jgi:8-oxo-dGTP pyrophosphatase MutT (NUDIX family)
MTVRHFTASAIVFGDDLDQVLLVHHNKIGKWLYPGGHIEPGQSPAEAAIREVEEETGIRTEVLSEPTFRHPAVTVHPVPFAILEVMATDKEFGEHRHVDFIYVLRATSTVITVQLDEVSCVRWVPVADIVRLDTPPDFPALVAEAVRWAGGGR